MIGGKLSTFIKALRQPGEELSRAQRLARFMVDLIRYCARQLERDQAAQMAAALTYRTIFSLVPVVVLMLLVFRAFGGFEQVQVDLEDRIYQYLGLSSITLPASDQVSEDQAPESIDVFESPSGTTDLATDMVTGEDIPPSAEDQIAGVNEVDQHVSDDGDPDHDTAVQTDQALRASIQKIIADLTTQASKANVGSIGAVGLLLLIWGALALVVTVEQSFNRIYKCPSGRPWHMRIAIYWASLTLGPVLLFVSLYVADAVVQQVEALVGHDASSTTAAEPGSRAGLYGSLGGVAALGSSWLLLFLSYVLLPNARVAWRSALAGSFVAALLWETGKWGFKLYVTRAVSYSVLYGTLGLIPLFLLWVYLTWLIVLFGLVVTYTLQAMRGRVFEQEALADRASEQPDPRWIFPIVTAIAGQFIQGKSITAGTLAHELRIPSNVLDHLVSALQRAGFIHQVHKPGDDNNSLALAQPPSNIRIADLLKLCDTISDVPEQPTSSVPTGARLLRELGDAQIASVGDKTLKDVMNAPPGIVTDNRTAAPGDGPVSNGVGV